MDRKEWESICRRCGKCCYEKVDLGAGEIIYTKEPCAYLDTTTNLCKVYENRQIEEPDCIELTESIVRSLNWLPPDCAYVEYIRRQDTLLAVQRAQDKAHRRNNSKRRR